MSRRKRRPLRIWEEYPVGSRVRVRTLGREFDAEVVEATERPKVRLVFRDVSRPDGAVWQLVGTTEIRRGVTLLEEVDRD